MATNEEIIAMCATTQADVKNICNTLDGMKQFMGKQIEQHTAVREALAVIQHVQAEMKENVTTYQQDCAKDRSAHEKRINDVENFQSSQLKIAGAVGGFCAFLVAGGIKVFDKIFS